VLARCWQSRQAKEFKWTLRDKARGKIFEGLWLLRVSYPFRSDYDARSTLSVDEAINHGERLMRAAHLREHLGGERSRPA
jgi:hypothetical protein